MFSSYDTSNLFTDLYDFEPAILAHTIFELSNNDINVDDFLTHYTPFTSTNEYDTIYNELQAREAGFASFQDAIDRDHVDDITEQDILFIRYFNIYTPLADMLCQWYNCSRSELAQHVRSGYYDASTATIYYVTGFGYNHIDHDLLGGNSDGTAEQTFLARCA